MKTTVIVISFCLLMSCGKRAQETSAESAVDSVQYRAAYDAFVFGLPLVLMDITHRKALDPANPMASADNTFKHLSAFPDATFRTVVRPNADTYYSSTFLDLRQEPMVLSVPDTKGRYYMMPMLDAYTNVFASPGKRTTGTKAAHFAITGPGFSGSVPSTMTQIKAPTNLVWIIGRTQVNSKADGEKVVVPIQRGYSLVPLSAFGKKDYKPSTALPAGEVPQGDPNEIMRNMPLDAFFNKVNQLMVDNPPASADAPALARFAAINVKPGGTFDFNAFNSATQNALKSMPAIVLADLQKFASSRPISPAGWSSLGKTGDYGTDYVQRAVTAYFGLGANLSDDALYPTAQQDADGNALNGANAYTIHFDKGQTPPANAFWSLTLYDPAGYMVANPINRNAIGDRDKLKFNKDGSLDIYIQQPSPGPGKESNWLPAPTGEFNLLLRVYWPKEEMVAGKWQMPPVRKNP